jgi:hypothetical protein
VPAQGLLDFSGLVEGGVYLPVFWRHSADPAI